MQGRELEKKRLRQLDYAGESPGFAFWRNRSSAVAAQNEEQRRQFPLFIPRLPQNQERLPPPPVSVEEQRALNIQKQNRLIETLNKRPEFAESGFKIQSFRGGSIYGGGTWSFNKTKLLNLMKKPLKASVATKKLYNVFGDDHLFDLIDNLKIINPDKNIWSDLKIKRFVNKIINQDEKSSPRKSPKKSSKRSSRKSPKKSIKKKNYKRTSKY
jgi:hypothetical protein